MNVIIPCAVFIDLNVLPVQALFQLQSQDFHATALSFLPFVQPALSINIQLHRYL